LCILVFFFFFQAEDGIRDRNVTGVQTCALPISVVKKSDHLDIIFPLKCFAIIAILFEASFSFQCISFSDNWLIVLSPRSLTLSNLSFIIFRYSFPKSINTPPYFMQ